MSGMDNFQLFETIASAAAVLQLSNLPHSNQPEITDENSPTPNDEKIKGALDEIKRPWVELTDYSISLLRIMDFQYHILVNFK